MFDKKNFLLNCDVCDTRKMKEEDYSGYEKMVINTDLVIVNERSKSILNRLPVAINQDSTIELPDDVEVKVKTVNGSYEITGKTMVQENTLLVVNGSLTIHPGTEAALENYEKIYVNGSVRCPKSLEGFLNRLSVNGSVDWYPDDCVMLDNTFVLDKYFPLRAREESRYYAKKAVVIKDCSVDIKKLVGKKVRFYTKRLIVPENLVEDCAVLFDEKVDFVVVPAGMSVVYGDVVLNEQLVEKEGGRIYVYGSVRLDRDCDADALGKSLEKLIVNGKMKLRKKQEEAFRRLNAEYDSLAFDWEGRLIENQVSVRIDSSLLENSPQKVLVRNAAVVKIADDAAPAQILDRLIIENCAKVSCSKEQESVVAAIAENVAKIGADEEAENMGNMDVFKNMLSTKMVNADNYIM